MIDPKLMNFRDWADAVSLRCEKYANIPIAGTDWHEWAEQVSGIPAIWGSPPPDHRQFSDWRDWANRFLQAART